MKGLTYSEVKIYLASGFVTESTNCEEVVLRACEGKRKGEQVLIPVNNHQNYLQCTQSRPKSSPFKLTLYFVIGIPE